jgi:hypothetical protein
MADNPRRFPAILSGHSPTVENGDTLRLSGLDRGARLDLAAHAPALAGLTRVLLKNAGGELDVRAHAACEHIVVEGLTDLRSVKVRGGDCLAVVKVEGATTNQACDLDVPSGSDLVVNGGPFRLGEPRHVTTSGRAHLIALNGAELSSATGAELTIQGRWGCIEVVRPEDGTHPSIVVINSAQVTTLVIPDGYVEVNAAPPRTNRDSTQLTAGVIKTAASSVIALDGVDLTVTRVDGPLAVATGRLTVVKGGTATGIDMREGTELRLGQRAVATDVRGALKLAAGYGAHLRGDPDAPPLLTSLGAYGNDAIGDGITLLDVRVAVGDASLTILSALEDAHRFSPSPTEATQDVDHGEAASYFETLLQLLKRKHAAGAAVVHAGWHAFDHRRAKARGVDRAFLAGYWGLGYGYRLSAALVALVTAAFLAGAVHQFTWAAYPHTSTFVPRGGPQGWLASIAGSTLGPINFLRPSNGWAPPGLGGMAYSLSLTPVTAAYVAAGAAIRRRIGLR